MNIGTSSSYYIKRSHSRLPRRTERSKDSKADFNLRSKKFREEYVGPFLKKQTRIGRRRADYAEKRHSFLFTVFRAESNRRLFLKLLEQASSPTNRHDRFNHLPRNRESFVAKIVKIGTISCKQQPFSICRFILKMDKILDEGYIWIYSRILK